MTWGCTNATVFFYRDPNIILWLVYIYVHLHRNQPYDVNLVRTLFEEAVGNSR